MIVGVWSAGQVSEIWRRTSALSANT